MPAVISISLSLSFFDVTCIPPTLSAKHSTRPFSLFQPQKPINFSPRTETKRDEREELTWRVSARLLAREGKRHRLKLSALQR